MSTRPIGWRSSAYLTADPAIDGARKIEPFASYATGANEMSSLDMAAGGQTIANHGLHHDPYFVERIDGPDGLVYQHESAGVQVLTPQAADTTVNILKGVLTRGTARSVGGLDGGARPSAGKTGTQDNNSNAWFVGFTPQLTTAVWVGDPEGLHPDGEHPRVHGGRGRQGAGRHVPGPHLEGVHGAGPLPPAGARLAGAGATHSSSRSVVPARQRMPGSWWWRWWVHRDDRRRR